MRRSQFLSLIKLATALLSLSIVQSRAQTAQERPVTVADGVTMTRIADVTYERVFVLDKVAQFSPDGTQFIVVIRKGNLELNTNDYSILLFNTADALNSPPPQILVTMSSSSNRPGVQQQRWLDNNNLVFLGENPGEPQQLYKLDINNRTLKRLTNHATSLIAYAMNAPEGPIYFIAEESLDHFVNSTVKRHGLAVTNEDLADLISDLNTRRVDISGKLFLVRNRSSEETPIKINDFIYSKILDPLSLSPDGKYLLLRAIAVNIPREWEEYQDRSLKISIAEALKRPENPLHSILRFTLVNTDTGTSNVLLNAPQAQFAFPEPLWSPDSRSVVIPATYLPLNETDPLELNARRNKAYTVEIALPDLQIFKISDERLIPVKWDGGTKKVLFDRYELTSAGSSHGKMVAYKKNKSEWKLVPVPDLKRYSTPLDVMLDEDMNRAPKITVRRVGGNEQRVLIDLNPQFRELQFGRVETITWKSTDGHEAIGELYWPTTYSSGKKYPLVIQTHGFNPDRFWIDGPFASGFAAQTLANKNFFVLQFNGAKNRQEELPWDSPKFFDYQIAAYDGAVDHLSEIGLIDSSHVGLLGFSWTGMPVKYALVRGKYQYGAAVVVDGDDAGYFQYVALSNRNPDLGTFFERLNGGPPFGEGLNGWVRNGPSFKFEKVKTPLMAQAVAPYSLLVEWEWFAALSRLGKPVELLYMPGATHIIEKPWDRMTSQQGSVDWFCFWLKGEEDPDPAKKDQYARWRELRKLQEANMKSAETKATEKR